MNTWVVVQPVNCIVVVAAQFASTAIPAVAPAQVMSLVAYCLFHSHTVQETHVCTCVCPQVESLVSYANSLAARLPPAVFQKLADCKASMGI